MAFIIGMVYENANELGTGAKDGDNVYENRSFSIDDEKPSRVRILGFDIHIWPRLTKSKHLESMTMTVLAYTCSGIEINGTGVNIGCVSHGMK